MELETLDIIQETQTENPKTITCFCCEEQCTTDDAYCESCGYPLHGTIEQRDQFINNRNYNLYELQALKKKTRSATNTLFVLAALFVLTGIFYYSTASEFENPTAILITYVIIGGIYTGLALWSKKQALPAIVSGLILFAIVQLLSMIEDPTYIFKGIIMKVIIIVFLIKGIRSANEAQNLIKTHNLR